MDQTDTRLWKILLIVSVLVALVNLSSLPNLYEDISGDGVPNRPQREPPVEYRWDIALSRIVISILSLGVSAYSLRNLRIQD